MIKVTQMFAIFRFPFHYMRYEMSVYKQIFQYMSIKRTGETQVSVKCFMM